jgi:hypothetical protein
VLDELRMKDPIEAKRLEERLHACFDHNQPKEKYTVKKGDTLGSIALKKLYHADLAQPLYFINVIKQTISRIDNDEDIEAIKAIKPKPGAVLLLPTDSQNFRNKSQHNDKFEHPMYRMFTKIGFVPGSDDTEDATAQPREFIASAVANTPAPKKALLALLGTPSKNITQNNQNRKSY